jgi:hypothetical protein
MQSNVSLRRFYRPNELSTNQEKAAPRTESAEPQQILSSQASSSVEANSGRETTQEAQNVAPAVPRGPRATLRSFYAVLPAKTLESQGGGQLGPVRSEIKKIKI